MFHCSIASEFHDGCSVEKISYDCLGFEGSSHFFLRRASLLHTIRLPSSWCTNRVLSLSLSLIVYSIVQKHSEIYWVAFELNVSLSQSLALYHLFAFSFLIFLQSRVFSGGVFSDEKKLCSVDRFQHLHCIHRVNRRERNRRKIWDYFCDSENTLCIGRDDF